MKCIIAYDREAIKQKTGTYPKTPITEVLATLAFIKSAETLPSGNRAIVETDIQDIDTVKSMVGDGFVVGKSRTYVPL
jgi:hypothetical protein